MLHKDSIRAVQLFGNISARYDSLRSIKGDSLTVQYIPYLDSLSAAIRFTGNDALQPGIARLKERLRVRETIRQKIAERKEALAQSLGSAQLNAFNKQAFYYSQQFAAYKSLLTDKKKREEKAMELIRNSRPFQDFFAKRSEFSALFPSSSTNNLTPAGNGLQTRAYVMSLIDRRRQSLPGTTSADLDISTRLQEAGTQVEQLRSKLSGGEGDLDMPGFKPNTQKTKSFLQRWELGYDIQSQRNNGILPSRTTLALYAGYRLNDQSVIGGGITNTIGLGNGWRDIRLTHEGIGFRSYIDVKVKGGFWFSGGYEVNHMQAFTRIASISDWQESALAGITKKLKIAGKKGSKIQLLYDFLHRENGLQALQFRIGQLF